MAQRELQDGSHLRSRKRLCRLRVEILIGLIQVNKTHKEMVDTLRQYADLLPERATGYEGFPATLVEASNLIVYLSGEVELARKHNRQVQGLINAAYGLVARVRMGQDYKEAREALVVAAFGVNDMPDEDGVNG